MIRQKYMTLTALLTATFLAQCLFLLLGNTEIGKAMVQSSEIAAFIAFCTVVLVIFFSILINRKEDEAIVPLDILSIVLSEFAVFFLAEKELNMGAYPAIKLVITIIAIGFYWVHLLPDDKVNVKGLNDILSVLLYATDFALVAWLIYSTLEWSFMNITVAFGIGAAVSYVFTRNAFEIYE